jgi:hypothetical protein
MANLPAWLVTLVIGGVFGLIVGIFIARESAVRKPIKGGPLANGFHYLGSSAFVAAAPTVLIGVIFFRLPFLSSITLAFGLLALVVICLVVYGVFEVRATGR